MAGCSPWSVRSLCGVAIGLVECGATGATCGHARGEPAVVENPVLLGMRDRQDVSAMRESHVADVGVDHGTLPAGGRGNGRAPCSASTITRSGVSSRFVRDDGRIEIETLAVAFDVRFDKLAAAHIRAHELGRRDHQRPFAEFPAGAIALKAVWYAVKQRGLTAMPVWDGAARADADGNPDRTWTRVVAIDPAIGATRGRTASVELANRRYDDVAVVPMSELFHETLDASDVARRARRHA